MADIKRCWVKTTHSMHGWTEVDGKVHSLVDASTVLQVPPGSNVGYHHCVGVPDLLEASHGMRWREGGPYGHDRRVEVTRTVNSVGITFITERRIALDAVYERDVIESPWVNVQQLTCWCCTCGERPGSDYLCRNHGYGFGTRPCEAHGVEGSIEVDPGTDEELGMPESVPVYRAAHPDA